MLPGIKYLPLMPEKQSWMQCPKVEAEFPGLAYAYPLNEFVVLKVRDALHDIIGPKGIAYTIFNNEGEKVFLAVQEKSCRKFNVTIFNFYGNEVIHVKKPWNLCLNKARVWAPPGNYVGSIQEERSCINTYKVMDKQGKTVLNIIAQGFNHFVYRILSGDEEIGIVKKNWGFAAVLSVTNFGMSFPEGAAVGVKAVLLGALFLIGSLKY